MKYIISPTKEKCSFLKLHSYGCKIIIFKAKSHKDKEIERKYSSNNILEARK